jgi:hypothetical protein
LDIGTHLFERTELSEHETANDILLSEKVFKKLHAHYEQSIGYQLGA